MSHPDTSYGLPRENRGECSSCGTSIPLSEPILVKFQRCYYCGRSHPFGGVWKGRTTPVIVVAAVAFLAIWWTRAPF